MSLFHGTTNQDEPAADPTAPTDTPVTEGDDPATPEATPPTTV